MMVTVMAINSTRDVSVSGHCGVIRLGVRVFVIREAHACVLSSGADQRPPLSSTGTRRGNERADAGCCGRASHTCPGRFVSSTLLASVSSYRVGIAWAVEAPSRCRCPVVCA